MGKVVIAAFFGITIGVVAGQKLPSTFLLHPILTLQTMRYCPIGSEVILAGNVNSVMREDFGRHGLGQDDYGTVEEFVAGERPDGKPKMNYQIRTKLGLLEADASYFRVLPGHHRFSSTPDGFHVIYNPVN